MITDGSHPSHMDPDPAQTPSPTALQSTTQQPCAATLVTSSLASLSGVSSGRSMSLPFSNRAPARTRATRWGPLTARQRPSAACSSLNTIASPVSRVPGPLVTLVRALTGENELSIGLVTGMKDRGCRLRPRIGCRCRRRAEEYGATVRDRGIREQTQVGQAGDRSMGCEPELVRGRPCDQPGCAASADP